MALGNVMILWSKKSGNNIWKSRGEFLSSVFQWLLRQFDFLLFIREWSGRINLEKEVKLFSYQQTVISLGCYLQKFICQLLIGNSCYRLLNV